MTKIGELIEGVQEKDAIHVAVAPVIAYCTLKPGEDIGFIKNDNQTVSNLAGKKIGIVDPFLKDHVQRGEKFWMFLYPNTIISLRHDWSHPDFDKNVYEIEKAKEWITKWASSYGMTYEYAMKSGERRDFFLGEVYYDQIPYEFWTNYELITGDRVSEDIKNDTYFHCAC